MNDQRELAGKGLYYVFLGEIAILAGVILGWVPFLGFLLLLGGLACGIYGYMTAAKGDVGYMNAVFCVAGGMVVNFLRIFAGDGLFAGLLGIASSVLSLAVVYFMCQTTGQLLEYDHPELAVRAAMLWKLYLACTVVGVACTLLSVIPLIGALAKVLGVLVSLAELVAAVLYLIFLYQAQKALR